MENVIEVERELEERALTLVERSMSVEVVDEASYGAAGALVKEAKAVKSERLAYFLPMKEKAAAAHKEICAKEKEAVKPLDEIINAVTGRQNAWLQVEHDRKQAEQRRLEAEAREAARREQEKLTRAAEKAELAGKAEKAAELIERAAEVIVAPVFAAPVVSAPVHTNGATSYTITETDVQVLDLKVFLAALIGTVNESSLRAMISVNAGPVKAWVKANGLEHHPGLLIEKTVKARNR